MIYWLSVKSFGFLPTFEFQLVENGFTLTPFDPPMYWLTRFSECLPTFKFHIFRDRFTRAIFDPPKYRFIISFECLPTVEFHIIGNGLAWTKFDPPSYRFTRIPRCLPTLVLKFFRDRAFIVFNKDTYFKFITINLIDCRTHLNLTLKK